MTTKKTAKRSGRPVNVYLGESDIARLRELGAWLMTQGHRVSDSQVIKAALIVAKPNAAFLTAFHEVLDADLRYRKP
jgi:hypothetical protein